MTALFLEDAYLSTVEAHVTGVREDGGILLDQTCFYATSGGQPGDTGFLEREDGSRIEIAGTVTGDTKAEIILIPAPDQSVPDIGEKLVQWSAPIRLPVPLSAKPTAGWILT